MDKDSFINALEIGRSPKIESKSKGAFAWLTKSIK